MYVLCLSALSACFLVCGIIKSILTGRQAWATHGPWVAAGGVIERFHLKWAAAVQIDMACVWQVKSY